jgi:triacylglycerol lipase
MSIRLRITCLVALCAVLSSTALVLGAGIAAACSGTGGGGCTTPTASTGSASAITSNSATLSGSVNAQGCTTYYVFEWGTSSSGPFPNSIEGSAGKETFPKTVSTNLTGLLQPSTQYYFRLSAINSEGKEATGSSVPFKTAPACSKPSVTTEPASFIEQASAQMNGSLNPNGCDTKYTFEYGPSSLPYQTKISETVSDRGFPFAVLKTASGLQPSTSYHFRLIASNSKGTTEGAEKTFITEGKDPILFVHGWPTGSGNASSFNVMVHNFELQGWPAAWLKTWTYTEQSNETIAQLVSTKVNELLQATGKPKVDIITHSMGGLSGRFYLKNLGGTSKVEDFVSLGGPNHGTTVTEIFPPACASAACIEMRPGSTFLTNLNAGDETPGSVRYMTVRALCDAFIEPDDSVILNGAVKNLAWTPTTSCLASHSALHDDWFVFTQVEEFVR